MYLIKYHKQVTDVPLVINLTIVMNIKMISHMNEDLIHGNA